MTHEHAALPPWLDAVADALHDDAHAVLVVVAHVSGSVPRESGAAMVVTRAATSGTIGGGHLEFEAIRLAREALVEPALATWIVRFPLAARVGQCCGGVATVVFSTLDPSSRSWIDAAQACARAEAAFACVARIGARMHARLVVSADDARGTLGDPALDSAAVAFARARLAAGTCGTVLMPLPGEREPSLVVQIERPDPFAVLVFGNGHVGRALVQVLGVLPAQVRWIDARDADFPASVPRNVEIVVTDVPEAELREAPPGSFVIVLTHSHALDFALIETALARDDWRYVGMIGSRAKRAQLERRLGARGIAAERMSSVVCPIGAALPGLTGKAPGSIAIAVAAQLLAVKAASARPHATLTLASPVR
ncbi:MAG TPA: xanthine dehydrogenase accessory protein XdhC [Casimicrobiaceae bacterium]|nr:xanthine dehydrogenase accessory protein XdhC [Casimicrobiaceae bacterium]